MLEHETLHFAISELVARKIRKGIDSLHAEKISDVDIYSEYIKDRLRKVEKLNALFDKHTNYGTFYPEQDKWKDKIYQELEKLNKFASSKDCYCKEEEK